MYIQQRSQICLLGSRLFSPISPPRSRKYRVFHLNNTSFIPLVEQHKLDSFSTAGQSKILQGLGYRRSNFSFSKNLQSFSKNSNSRTKNDIDVQFSPKYGKFNAAFLVRKLGAQVVWFVKYKKFNVEKMIENFKNFLNFYS